MKKWLLAVFLALCMICTLLPAIALAENTDSCPGGSDCTHQAAIGTTHYDTLTEAISAAGSGTTVTLLNDVTLSDNISLPDGVTLKLSGEKINAGDYKITLGNGSKVITAKNNTGLNSILTASDYLISYTESETGRTYTVSDVLVSDPEVFMTGHATTITAQDGTDADTNLFLTYYESGLKYVALYNSDKAARIFGGWKNPAAGVSTESTATALTIKSGKVDSLRGSSKAKDGSTIASATINVEGGTVGIVASGWYYNQSVKTFNVNVSGGSVTTVYGNGQTSYKASADMPEGFVPTVDTANINISGGTVGYVYGSGRALTQNNISANYSMLTKNANITITGGTVDYVNGGGFNGPEANWGETSGQDLVTVDTAVITVSGGTINNLFAGGYNGQWKYTYKINADGELVFSNYNGTDETTRTVRNIVNSATVNVQNGANITNLYMGGRSYAYVKNSVANITGGNIGTMSTSGNYGYVENSDANVSGGTIAKLELVTRNYVGNVDLDVTGGTVTDFYAGMGGAYKNSNCNEKPYNISTVAILGDVDVNFADGTVTNSYLTTGLERADSVTSNVPLTVKKMNLAASGYTEAADTSGEFVMVNNNAVWNTTINFETENESFKPGSAATGIIYTSSAEGVVVVEDGVRKLGDGGVSYEAEINGTHYKKLTDAISAAAGGNTVKLLDNVTLNDTITINKDITIDLGVKTISADSAMSVNSGKEYMFVIAGNVNVKNGTINSEVSRGIKASSGKLILNDVDMGTYKRAIMVDNAIVTVDKDCVIKINADGKDSPIVVWGTGDYKKDSGYQHPTLHIYGKVDATEQKVSYAAVSGNGTDYSYTYIYIYDGAELRSNGHALYVPQAGEVYISGGTLTGSGAVGIKSGKLVITGGVLNGIGTYDADIETSGGGINSDGSAINIDSNGGYAGEIEISISGNAALNSENGHAIREVGAANGASNVTKLNITGGMFSAGAGKDDVVVRDVTKPASSITGGYYNSDPSPYLADGYKVVDSDKQGYTYMVRSISSGGNTDNPAINDNPVDNDHPDTGDNFISEICMVIVMLAAIGFAVSVVIGRRRGSAE